MKKFTKTQLYTILTGLFVGSLLIANVLAPKLVIVGDWVLPGGVVVFPIVYIVNDILAEVYGFKNARRVILLAFVVNLLAVLSYNIVLAWESPVFVNTEAFTVVLSNTARTLVASFTAYLIGTTLNSLVMVKMRGSKPVGGKGFFTRAVTSTFVGEGLDSIIFVIIAFIGQLPIPVLLTMALTQAIFKTTYEIVAFPITQILVNRVKNLPEGNII